MTATKAVLAALLADYTGSTGVAIWCGLPSCRGPWSSAPWARWPSRAAPRAPC